MIKKSNILLPILLVVFSFLLRWSLISQGPYHTDCMRLAMTSEQILVQKKLLYLQASGLPLTALLGSVFISILKGFGSNDIVFAVNWMSVFFSSWTVVLFYFFAKKLFDSEKTGFFAAVILSCNPIFLATSVFGNSHQPALFFLLLTFLWLLKAKAQSKATLYFGAGVFFGLMAATRLQDAAIAFPACLYFIFSGRRYQNKQNGAIFLLSGFLTCAVFYLPMLGREKGFSPGYFKDAFSWNILQGVTLDQCVFTANVQHFVSGVTFFGAVITVGGLIFVYTKRKEIFPLFLLWIVPGILCFGTLTFARPRLFLVSVLGCVLLEGWILSYRFKNRYVNFLFLGLFFFVIALSLNSVYPTLALRHAKAFLPDFYRWVNQKTENNALIIERDMSPLVAFYAERENFQLPNASFSIDENQRLAIKEKLDQELRQGRPIYITGTGLAGYDPALKYEEFIRKNYELIFIGHQLIESWQGGTLVSRIGLIPLYKVELKQPGDKND